MNNENTSKTNTDVIRSQQPNPNFGNGSKPSTAPNKNPNPNFTPPPSKK